MSDKNLPDLNDMRLFATVVEQGGFSAASRFLDVPKSTLSRRIASLEESLGVRLLQRSTRSTAVTAIGQEFYAHCRAMLIEARAAQAAVASAQSAPCGSLHLSCPIALLHMQVGEVLAAYMQRYPEVQLRVSALNRAVDVIAEGVDIALRVRPDPLESSELALRRLGSSAQVLVASPSLLAEYGAVQTLTDVMPLPSLAPMGHEGRWLLADAQGAWHELALTPRLVCSDMASLQQAALAGLGVVQLPQALVQADMAAGRLQALLPQYRLAPLNVHAVFASRRGLLPAMAAMLDMLSAAFAASPHWSCPEKA